MNSSAIADIIENNYSSDTAVTNRNDGYSSDYDADDESDKYSPQSPQRVVRRTRSSNNKPFKAAKGKKTSSSIWINLEDEDADTTGPTPMTERVNQKEHKEMGRLGERKRSQDEGTDNSSHSSTEKRSICSSKTSKTEPMDNETMTTTWRPEDEPLGAVLTCSSVQLRKIIQILCHLRDMCSGSCDDDASKIEYQTEIQRIIDFLNIRAAGNNVGARADHLKEIMVILKETDPQKRLADLFNYELYLKRQKALQVKGMGGC
ncbi:hypothetical protein FPQ18DRAFT_423259 [Pyronema domesticum]|nr:hypothetical protein FPQ18DRAFT_423259 [Pyronema domesticum]